MVDDEYTRAESAGKCADKSSASCATWNRSAMEWARKMRPRAAHLKLLLVELAALYRPGKPLFPSQVFLAERLNCSARHVRAGLAELERHGYIERTKRSHGYQGRASDLFKLCFNRLADNARAVVANGRERLRNAARQAMLRVRQLAHRTPRFASGTPHPGSEHLPTRIGDIQGRTTTPPTYPTDPGWAYAMAKGLVDGPWPADYALDGEGVR